MGTDKAIRILLMDDDPEFAWHAQQQLTALGFEVEAAQGAGEAFSYFSERPFDALVTDMIVFHKERMIADGGVLLIHRLKALAEQDTSGKPFPIIAISGSGNLPGLEHILELAKQMGADRVFAKPVNFPELAAALKELLGISN